MSLLINGLEINNKDLEQRYKYTYFVIRNYGVVYLREVNERGMRFSSKEKIESIIPFEEIHIEKEFPEMGAVNHEGNVHFLTRIPYRQWSRGFARDVINDFCRNPKIDKFKDKLSIEEASSCFNRIWIPFKEGVQQIKGGKIKSFAINKRYWFSGRKNNLYLWRDHVCIGQLFEKSLFLFPSTDILKQEIKDDLKEIIDVSSL